MVRHLGPVDYGSFVTVASLIFIVGGVTEGGLGNVGVREFTAMDGDARRRLLGGLLGLRIALTTFGVAVALAFALAAGYRSVMVQGTVLAGLGLLVVNVQNTLTVPLQARLSLGWLAASDFIRQVATAALMIALVIAGASLLPFYAVSLATAALVLGLTLWLVRGEGALPSADGAQWRWLLRQTTIYAAATALGVVYFQVAIISMSLLSTDTETGFYGLAFRIIDLANGVPWVLATS